MYGKFLKLQTNYKFCWGRRWNTSIRRSEMGEIHTCNLISLNLAELTSDELEKYVALAVRALDNTIDLNCYTIKRNQINITYYIEQ